MSVGIQVLEATYGPSCGTQPGNVTGAVAAQCNGSRACNVFVNNNVFGDPAFGCPKDFVAVYSCDGSGQFTASHGPVSGEGYSVQLTCP
jgi:hypothetical protein